MTTLASGIKLDSSPSEAELKVRSAWMQLPGQQAAASTWRLAPG